MKKALIVYGGWEGHEPEPCARLAGNLLRKEGFDVELSASLDSFKDEAKMSALSLVIPVWTMGQIQAEQAKGLMAAVRAGVGLAGWHGGMCDAFRTDTDYQFMTGGQFVAHPGGIIDYTVNIVDAGHEITRGLKDFNIKSEQYYMHTDPGNKVLATTTFSGNHGGIDWIKGTVMPVVWVRQFGMGRVFYSSLGHVAGEFNVPEVRELTRRGMVWAAR